MPDVPHPATTATLPQWDFALVPSCHVSSATFVLSLPINSPASFCAFTVTVQGLEGQVLTLLPLYEIVETYHVPGGKPLHVASIVNGGASNCSRPSGVSLTTG